MLITASSSFSTRIITGIFRNPRCCAAYFLRCPAMISYTSLEGCCSYPPRYGSMLQPQAAFSMFSVTIFSAKEKPPAPLTDGHDNTKDLLAMMEESWHPCTYIPYISFGHHKQTNLPSANSPLDMLMPALNGCICVHGVYLPFPEFPNQLYITRYRYHQ